MAYDYFSAQLTNADAVPRVINPPIDEGRVFARFFKYTVPAGGIAAATKVELQRMKKGDRPLIGFLTTTALSSAGGDASIQLGDGTTAAAYKATTSVDAIASFDFMNTPALGSGVELTADTSLVATVTTEAWVAAGIVTGYVLYLRP